MNKNKKIEVLRYYLENESKIAVMCERGSDEHARAVERIVELEELINIFKVMELHYLPLINGEMFLVPMQFIFEYEALYKNLDIRLELGRMKEWFVKNPSRRKSEGDIKKFIDKWLLYENNHLKRRSG